jgi:hypothetical protein
VAGNTPAIFLATTAFTCLFSHPIQMDQMLSWLEEIYPLLLPSQQHSRMPYYLLFCWNGHYDIIFLYRNLS